MAVVFSILKTASRRVVRIDECPLVRFSVSRTKGKKVEITSGGIAEKRIWLEEAIPATRKTVPSRNKGKDDGPLNDEVSRVVQCLTNIAGIVIPQG